MSLISLWRIEGKPPRRQESMCSTVKWAPYAQLLGVLEGDHPYLRARASTKAPLWREKPCSSRGRAVSQLEEPLPRKVHGPLEGGSELIPQVICVGDGLLAPPPLYVGFGRHLVARGFIGVLVVLVMDQLPKRSSD